MIIFDKMAKSRTKFAIECRIFNIDIEIIIYTIVKKENLCNN